MSNDAKYVFKTVLHFTGFIVGVMVVSAASQALVDKILD